MKESSPSFQFYPGDFLSDANVMAMSLEEVGAYVKLLCVCWREGSIPIEEERIGRLIGVDSQAIARLWPGLKPCFAKRGDRLVQPRLERERSKQTERRERLAEAGRKGGSSRGKRVAGQEARPKPGYAQASSESQASLRLSSSSASSVRTHTPPRTRTVPGADQTAPGAGGGGDPEPETRPGPDQTGPHDGRVSEPNRQRTPSALERALAALGIDALGDPMACCEIATELAQAGITAADVATLDKCAQRSGRDHDGGTGRGVLLSWLRSPARAREQLRGYEKRNPPMVNGADRTGPVVLADGDARYAERRAKVDVMAAALDELSLEALEERPARLRACAEGLVDTELTIDDVRRLERHAGALAAKSPDRESDPDGRDLLGHWLTDVRLAREVVAGLELGEQPTPAKRDGFDLGPIFGEGGR